MEASEPVAPRSATPTVGGAAVGNVRRRRVRAAAPQTTAPAQSAFGGTAPQPTRAQSVRTVVVGVGGPRHADDHRRTFVVADGSSGSRGRIYRCAVPGCGKRRAVEHSDHGRGLRAERVVRTRVSHVNRIL